MRHGVMALVRGYPGRTDPIQAGRSSVKGMHSSLGAEYPSLRGLSGKIEQIR